MQPSDRQKIELHPDILARTFSGVALLVSFAALYYAWTVSPYFHAPPEQMSYWYEESNRLTEGKMPKSAKLEVSVYNDSARPAKDVLVVVTPLYPGARIACTSNYKVLDGPRGSKLITIERVAPKSTVTVHVNEDVTEYPGSFSFLGGAKFRYCATVDDVQTEFGAVRRHFPSCKSYVQRLPGDDGKPLI